MWFRPLFERLGRRRSPAAARRRPPVRLRLEALEERWLPSLTPAATLPVGSSPHAVVTADFNSDGNLDLAASGGGTVSVLPGEGDGTFAAARHFASPSAYGDLAVGDFNGDGNTDLVTCFGWSTYDTAGGGIDVLLGNGDGTFRPAQQVPVPEPPGMDGSGGYAVTGYGPVGVRVADADADGRSDLWVDAQFAYYYYGDIAPFWGTYSAVLLGAPDGSFAPGSTEAFPPPPAAPDLNADGRGDAVAAASNGVGVRLGRADGTLAPELLFSAGQSPWGVAVGDFNGDGRPDVAVANAGSNDVSVLLNDGAWPAADAPTVRVNNVVVSEGNTGTAAAVFTLTLSAALDEPITVAYRTADATATAGSDYQAASGTLTFAPGETSKAVTVLVNGDRLGEPDDYFLLKLDQPANAFLATGSGTGSILDDEPRVSINDVSAKEGNGKTTVFTFTVTLSAAYDAPVTVRFATADGTARSGDGDYVGKSGTLTFAPGETTKTVAVVVNGDKKREGNEAFVVNLTDLSSYAWLLDGQGMGTILNDD